MALTLPKLSLPKFNPDKKQLLPVVLGAVVLAAAAWFGWQYFMEEPAPPPPAPKPQAVTPAKKPAPPKPEVDAGKARDQLIEDVLVTTGLKQQLHQLPQRLVAGVQQSGRQQDKGSAARARAIETAVAQSFSAEGFQGRVGADLRKNFDQTRMQALLKDFSTPEARTMVALERAAHSPEELAQFARSTAATRPAPERAALLRRIDAATRASDLAVDVAFISMKELGAGIAGTDTRKSAAIDKTIEKQRAAATRRIRDATLLNLALSFKDASDADLAKYAGIYEAENSKWFYGLVYTSLLDEVRSASTRAGQSISELKGKPAAAAEKPAAVAARPARSMSGADARVCLGRTTNTAVIRCAEQYR